MATSSRQSNIFGVNDWKSIYQTYSQADLQSYDYETLRKIFVDYLRTYYPETFNDYTESSEYIALLDIIAFMGQALAFRSDLNARENFIDTAERRDSVIKLANLVNYNPKRNFAGQGFLKITSVQTTEQVRDINGINLSNAVILWNDTANPNWQEQFNSVINACLVDTQRVGKPGHSQSILNVKTDEYGISVPPSAALVYPFSSVVNGTSMNFECVSVTSVNSESLYEIPPGPNNQFNMVYRNDQLGYGSPNTGFFLYFKQGSLQTYPFTISQQISNNIIDVNIQGINNDDTWLYEVASSGTFLQWNQVENLYSNANLQNINGNKKLFSVVSGFNDQVSYTFGDGVFADIPVGNYVAYLRAGNALTYSIDPVEMQNVIISIPYVSRTGRTETLSLTLDLPLPITNAQARESLQNIKERAPKTFYSQNRMVNGEDYNNFPYTLYSSIIKSKAINRTSVGVSRNYDLTDPSANYSSVTDITDDGGLFEDYNDGFLTFNANTVNTIINFLTGPFADVLGGNRVFQYYSSNYNRYLVDNESGDGIILWHQTTFNNLNSTGYLYSAINGLPVQVGVNASGSVKYITPGALLNFTAPSGFYFNEHNQLVAGLPTQVNKISIWTSVDSVVGDGYNSGYGNLDNGLGPVTLTNAVPQGAFLNAVIPSFTNELSSTLIQEIVNLVVLQQNFSLFYDNSKLANDPNRWSISTFSDPYYFAKFQSNGNGTYTITYKSTAYYFGSVNNVRFTFDRDKVIYDPLSGKTLQDHIKILKTNNQPYGNYPMYEDVTLNVVGQTTESDGYVDDYAIEVAIGDLTVPGSYKDPDFFTVVTGYQLGVYNNYAFVFFQQIIDANNLTRYTMVSSNDIIYQYGSLSEINTIKNEFVVGTVFYAYRENLFYYSYNDPIKPHIVDVGSVSGYSVKIGRQGLFFQYKHISDNTTRIDPGTSNIIDMYLVTQSYYTSYQNWIKDTTGTVSKPAAPSINDLATAYNKINDYKMLTDNVILNTVQFKPLFGQKADPLLRATIKVIKTSTTTASDSEIISNVLAEMNNYFAIDNWNFGDTFYFSELSAYLHSVLGDLVSSVVLVPNDTTLKFGDLYEIRSAPYEIFVNAAQASDISVITALTAAQLQIG